MALQFYYIAGMLIILFVYFTQIEMPLYFSTISTPGTLTSGPLRKIKLITSYNDPNSSPTSVYRKKTFTGSLTNYFSFTSYFYEIRHFIKCYCNDLYVKLVFSTFKIGNLLVWKTLSLTGSVHVWFISLYVLVVMPVTSGPSHFKHLQDSAHCRALCSAENFHVLDHASTGFKLQIKEAIHIQREQPSLNLTITP
ncbi:hypothetical protein pdam_00013520, partial [Pocillopora damicornis]